MTHDTARIGAGIVPPASTEPTPLDRVRVEAARIARKIDERAHREHSNLPTTDDLAWTLKACMESWWDTDAGRYPYDKISIEECRQAIRDVSPFGPYWGKSFDGIAYGETTTMRLAVEVEVNVGEYLLSRAEVVTEGLRRHVLDDLPPQARDELRQHIANLRYVESVRYVQPRVELRWE